MVYSKSTGRYRQIILDFSEYMNFKALILMYLTFYILAFPNVGWIIELQGTEEA